MMQDKHTFAFFFEELDNSLKENQAYTIHDKLLIHRISQVVRAKAGDIFILFNQHIKIVCVINEITLRQSLYCTIMSVEHIKRVMPSINLYQASLKKEFFESVIYTATQMGVSKIIPLTSEKIQFNFDVKKNEDRIKRIMIAAAEQSKQFIFPIIEPFCSLHGLSSIQKNKNSSYIFFDIEGIELLTFMNFVGSDIQEINVCCGPEGGFAVHERELLLENGFKPVALTSSILRSFEAVIVGLGAIRSLK